MQSVGPKHRRWILGAIVLALALAAALRWQSEPAAVATGAHAEPTVAVARGPVLAALPAAQPSARRCPLALGVERHYSAQAQLQELASLRWSLQMRAERGEPDGTTIVQVAAQLTDEHGVTQTAARQLVRLGPDCRQLAYAWRAGDKLPLARQVQARLATFDFALPDRNGEVVHGEARDDSGRYRFAAVRSEADGKVVVQRRVQSYVSAFGKPAGLLFDGPGLRVELGSDAWPVAASLAQTVRQALATDGAVSVRASLALDPSSAPASALGPADLASSAWIWGNLLADVTLRDAARFGDDARWRGMPAAELLGTLAATDPEGEHIEAALGQLHAWLLANPNGAAQLQAWLLGRSAHYSDDVWARMALAALSRAGTPAARAALRSLADQAGLAPAMRLHALINLATAEGLDGTDIAAVRAWARQAPGATDGLSPNAALSALGAMARSESVSAAERAGIVNDLRDALHGQASTDRLVAAVNGAGNSGAAELLPELQALANHTDTDVRRRVADALRAMPQQAAQAQSGWLGAWLQSEQAPQVAVALVAALEQQWPVSAAVPDALLAGAVARLQAESNSAVAVALANWLGGAAGSSAAARQALLNRFNQEFLRGDRADTALMQAIGAHVDAKNLVGAM